jgi:L-malate glycosyltransferase
MNIGIASPCDISCFTPFFGEDAIKIINRNFYKNSAPAVNTLILSFIQAGHYVRIFTLSKETFTLKGHGIDIYGIEICNHYPIKYLWGDFINAKAIQKIMQDHIADLDVINAHWTYAYAFASAHFTEKLPVFCTVRDWASYIWEIESLKNKITWSFRYVMNELVFQKKGIHFIANSPYTAALVKKKCKIDVPVIPNSIDASFITNGEHVNPDHLEILCISSSNDQRKNVKTLLLAFKKFINKYPSAKLSLIGSPFTEKESIAQRWKKRGLLNGVALVGAVDHARLKKYLDKASLFVTPSLEETFGNTLLESMARKVPVVAGKNSGAVPYVLDQGKAGFLCDVSSADDLAQSIEFVYTHPYTAKQVARYAYGMLAKNYLASKVQSHYIELYKKVIRWEEAV